METSPTNNDFDEEQLAKFASRLQAQLAPCVNCQPCDEGKPAWLNFHAALDDLMEMVGVPEAYWKEVARSLDCPCCHRSHGLCEEVGYKGDVEVLYCELADAWCREYKAQFDEFHKYLEDFPQSGLNHEFGRRIYKQSSGFPTTGISQDIWYGARRIVDGREPTPLDFYPPDHLRCVIREGRFDHPGRSVFYLAGNKYGAVTEIMREDETRAWVQKFRIQGIVRILDLTHEEGWAEQDVALIAAGLMYVGAATPPVKQENGCKPEYLVPQFVADCVRAHGFEGISFKSARHYLDNLLLFKFEPDNISPEGEPAIVKVGKSYRRPLTDIGGITSGTEGLNDEPSLGRAEDLQNQLQPARHSGRCTRRTCAIDERSDQPPRRPRSAIPKVVG